MTATTAPVQPRDIVSWDELDRLVAGLAARLEDERFDVMLAITRGGLVPAGMLAYRLRIRNILVAAVEFYDDEGRPGPRPTFLQFPADPLLRGQRILVVDEVWDSGTTIHAVTERVRQAGGLPTTAVLHYKPARSVVPGATGCPRGRRPMPGSSIHSRPGVEGDRSMTTHVRLLVGTKKGAFILDSDADAARLVGPRPAVRGLAVHDLIVEPGSGAILVAAGNAWYGPAVWRSDDGGETWTHSSAGMTYGDEAEPMKTIWRLATTPDGSDPRRGRAGRPVPER